MPSKNLIREYAPESYYHIYNRGVEKRKIFLDDNDYIVFLGLLKRYLAPEPKFDRQDRLYANYSENLELLAYCLMPNHFHLLIYQHDNLEAFTKLMRRVSLSYTIYFNKRYKRVGHLFQSHFKAKKIDNDIYLQHISRYIHLNPRDYETYKWSSLPYFLDGSEADWVKPGRILELFWSKQDYLWFIDDYKDYKTSLSAIKSNLANY